MNADPRREVAIRSASPNRRSNATEGSLLLWSLTDLRYWWTSPARYRWTRALGLAPAHDLTNFGDLR